MSNNQEVLVKREINLSLEPTITHNHLPWYHKSRDNCSFLGKHFLFLFIMRFIGIDVAKDKLDIFIDGEFFVLTNNKHGYTKLKKLLQADDVIGLEPTNVYHQALVTFLVEKDFTVQLIDPLISSRYQRLTMRKQHNDQKAAEALSELTALNKGRVVQRGDIDATLLELRRLTRARQGLIKQRSAIKNKLKRVQTENDAVLKKAYTALIKDFTKQIKMIEEAMLKTSKENASIEILTSVPGVSMIFACIILAELGNIHRFSNSRKIISFAGYDPSKQQSGSSINKQGKLSKRGSPHLRHILHLTAFANLRSKNTINAYYCKKKDEGKHYHAAITAAARKILQIIYALLKKQELFV